MTPPTPTLLLVDDEQALLTALKRTLSNQGYRVLAANSAAEALKLLDAGGVDLILSDLDMPEMTGLQLLARVRRSHPDVGRMLLTGGATLDSALQAINTGEVYRYLTKPWDNASLRETIREAFERLEDLRRAVSAEWHAEQRRRLLVELEREHPGIGTVVRDSELYQLDGGRLDLLAASLRSEVLRAFFSPSP